MPSDRSLIGPPSDTDEVRTFGGILDRTYLRSREESEAWLKHAHPADLRVVRRDGRLAGGLRLLQGGQWFGGREVPMTGVASVAVDPEHRAGGLATALMRATLEELHAAGAAISVLYPATQPVYRRVGYELAGSWIRYRVACAAIDVRDRGLEVRRLEPETARPVLQRLYDARARRTAGQLARSDDRWERVLSSDRDEVHAYVAGPADAPEGYLVFSQHREHVWKYDLQCRDLVALTPAAGRRLLTFAADHRSFSKDLLWTGAPAEPLLMHLREQDWERARSWEWMLRIVDVRGALEARGYAPGLDGELHLEVRDDVLPWNDGRFVLAVTGGNGKVRKGGRGRLRIDVRGLASLYTGYLGAEELLATDYIEGPDKDLAAATAAFAGPAPWLADFF